MGSRQGQIILLFAVLNRSLTAAVFLSMDIIYLMIENGYTEILQ
jgi:hypothetical protein